MPDAAYYRAWRAAHPEYRRREVARTAARRSRFGREDRTAEYARHRATRASRAAEPIPTLHCGHELFDRAREIVGAPRSGLTVLLDPLYDDLLSVATLALLEGADAVAAVKRYAASEGRWRRVTGPIYENVA